MKMLTEVGVRRLVQKVAEGEELPVPEVTFVDHHISHTHDAGITLMSPAFFSEHRVGTAEQYRLLVLHEMAHWSRRGEGHTGLFYHELFLMCLTYGVRISVAFEDEVKYQPRAARRGLERLVA